MEFSPNPYSELQLTIRLSSILCRNLFPRAAVVYYDYHHTDKMNIEPNILVNREITKIKAIDDDTPLDPSLCNAIANGITVLFFGNNVGEALNNREYCQQFYSLVNNYYTGIFLLGRGTDFIGDIQTLNDTKIRLIAIDKK